MDWDLKFERVRSFGLQSGDRSPRRSIPRIGTMSMTRSRIGLLLEHCSCFPLSHNIHEYGLHYFKAGCDYVPATKSFPCIKGFRIHCRRHFASPAWVIPCTRNRHHSCGAAEILI